MSENTKIERFTDPLALDCGTPLPAFEIAYTTYGTLNQEKSNAILVCHPMTLDQYAAETHPKTGKPGWWNRMIGAGKTLDTDRFFVFCPNVLGGCMGSSGPSSIDPKTDKPYGLSFPQLTIADMVRAQAALVERLGIKKLLCVIGGSMGGMQVLQWAADYPDLLHSAVPIAAAARHSAQNIAFHEVGRQAIMADPHWQSGKYSNDQQPTKGLAVARMAAHITYMSQDALAHKFGRGLQDRDEVSYGFDADFQIESYLRHQGMSFVDRFDANSYLYISRAMDYFDLTNKHEGGLANTFANTKVKFCVVSFTSDWLYPTSDSRLIVQALNANAAQVSFVEIKSDKGHDAFLLDEPEMFTTLTGFINATAKEQKIK